MAVDPAIQLERCRDQALVAIDADDWAGVVKACVKAELILATIPDSRIGNMSDVEWDRPAIRQLRQRAEAILSQGDGCGLEICNVEYVGLGSYGDGGCSC